MAHPITTNPLTTAYLCGSCRKRIRPDWSYCAYCAEPLEWPPEESPAMDMTPVSIPEPADETTE